MTKAKAKKMNITRRARFIETAHEAECSEDESEFDQNLKWITKQTAIRKKQPHVVPK